MPRDHRTPTHRLDPSRVHALLVCLCAADIYGARPFRPVDVHAPDDYIRQREMYATGTTAEHPPDMASLPLHCRHHAEQRRKNIYRRFFCQWKTLLPRQIYLARHYRTLFADVGLCHLGIQHLHRTSPEKDERETNQRRKERLREKTRRIPRHHIDKGQRTDTESVQLPDAGAQTRDMARQPKETTQRTQRETHRGQGIYEVD